MYGKIETKNEAILAAIKETVAELMADSRCKVWAEANAFNRFILPTSRLADDRLIGKIIMLLSDDDVCEWFDAVVELRMVASKADHTGRVYRQERIDQCPLLNDICLDVYHRFTTAATIGKLVEKYGKTPYEINRGQCEEFAAELSQELGDGATLADDDADGRIGGHVWTVFHGRHYDAEAPYGVDDPQELPFFKGQ
jgi:hypothetical protein